MASKIRDTSLKDSLQVFLPALALTVAGFLLAYQFVDPAPPSRFVLATGSSSGAYYRYAKAYQAILARDGVEIEIRQTAGSLENLSALRSADGAVQVAFVQGGTGHPQSDEKLVSLASLYFEPVWVFYQRSDGVSRLADLNGRRLAVGAQGSGTHALAVELLAANGVSASTARLLPLGGDEAVEALLSQQVDALFVVSGADSSGVQRLLNAPDVALFDFERAGAYTRRYRYLSSITLPQGVVNLVRNQPPNDTRLVAAAATLVARNDFHPALIDLLMAATAEVHRGGGVFEDYDAFPSPQFLEFPLSDESRRFFKSGPSFLRRVLPFWAATLVERTLVLLLPLVALLIPLLRVLPPVYRWRIRSRIYRWYRELLSIDPSVHGPPDADTIRAGLRELARIEEEVAKVEVPMSYADQLYHLRVHLELVREKLQGGPDAQS